MQSAISVPIIDAEPMASVLRSLQLQTLGEDRFQAESLPQIRRVYGGQVIAQGLLAAASTIADGRLPHSLHAYFLRGGDPDRPFELDVDRVRDGRSFSGRAVSCHQDDKEILTMSASFKAPEQGKVFQPEGPQVPEPESLQSALEIFRTMDHPVAKFLGKTAAFDVRHVQKSLYTGADASLAPSQQLWMRPRHDLPAALPQVLHRVLLAYVIDQIMMEPALRATGLSWITEGMSLASLDHAMWFHRDIDINDWMLYEGRVNSVGDARASCSMSVYDPAGNRVATATQEGMIRVPTEEQTGSGRWGFGS